MVVGVIFNTHGQVLLSTRPEGKSYEGCWEFAGGKIEAGESTLEALKREFFEELNLEVKTARYWLTKTHRYPSAHIHLNFFIIDHYSGEIETKEGQKISWQYPSHLTVSPILAANESIIKALCLSKVLSGYWEERLVGLIGEEPIEFYPYLSHQDHENVILSATRINEYIESGELPFKNKNWILGRLVGLEHWQDCYELGVNAIIFSILDEDDIAYLLSWLKKGMPTPLIVDNPNHLNIDEILEQYYFSEIKR